MAGFDIQLTPDERKRFAAAAEAAHMKQRPFAKMLLSPWLHGRQSSVFLQPRAWVLEFQRSNLERQLAMEEQRLPIYEAVLAQTRDELMAKLRRADVEVMRSTIAALRAAIIEIQKEESLIRNTPTTTAPAFVVIPLAAIGTPSTSTWGLAAGLVVVALVAVLILKRRRIAPAARKLLLRQREEPAEDDDSPELFRDRINKRGADEEPRGDSVGMAFKDVEDLKRRLLYDPTELRDRLDDFLEQENSEDILRRFFAETTFNAHGTDRRTVQLRLRVERLDDKLPPAEDEPAPATKQQATRVMNPPNAARPPPRAQPKPEPEPRDESPSFLLEEDDEPEPMRVEVAAGSNGNGHHGNGHSIIEPPVEPLPRKTSGRPRGSKTRKGGDEE